MGMGLSEKWGKWVVMGINKYKKRKKKKKKTALTMVFIICVHWQCSAGGR